ncbi:hypothetical protein IPO96_03490 [Candidatus Saccharibacteria bacterium]|jgi:hypothetical protein|nr:MAG: hypothetical protein IPO96_03490 [Candidatus Saccharibacteria bacterium]
MNYPEQFSQLRELLARFPDNPADDCVETFNQISANLWPYLSQTFALKIGRAVLNLPSTYRDGEGYKLPRDRVNTTDILIVGDTKTKVEIESFGAALIGPIVVVERYFNIPIKSTKYDNITGLWPVNRQLKQRPSLWWIAGGGYNT